MTAPDRTPPVLLLILALGCGGPPAPAPAPLPSPVPIAWPAQADSGAVWARNRELIAAQATARRPAALAAQSFDARLAVIAFDQARHCASIGTLTHTRPDGSSPFPQLAAIGYPYPRGQENGWRGGVASNGQPWPWTPDDVVAGWMGSPGHRANLLGDFDAAGFGWARDPAGRLYVFGCYGKKTAP